VTGTEVALIIGSCGTVITAMGQLYNVFNIRRLERNTNSISARNEAIAKQLGVTEGVAQEKANPT
jgi:uncharacterized membrane protein